MRRKRKAKAASHGPADNASNNGEKKPESGSQNANSSSSSTSKPSANNPNAPSKDLASQMRKMVIEAADPPPNPIPNGVEAEMAEVKKTRCYYAPREASTSA
ncbi:hypothetical protein TUN199_09968 [Pyrenophora tritici-repentis]|uniref:Uncharacterized protein n=1 Tax=Pyrenophora tritici-repentis TaxID=45151 RepID=A0A317AYM4_9PLEO|nr:hypothetical protein A1F99_087910 [Pyrenophora tritici-repentis]KAF7569709.1 hypothetical protein PtrM4_121240 [Pyrenophora tritici-repentis]KAI0573700.1 hypothetical protein Alg130_09981 [Pyrenophora tritici-repentis]KAI0576934.1 hypothetical protein Alg215_07208 [Pyrenophora tritici-repentis]KAI0605847.1 hypothetical protein TUN205_09899 [Pyrenophora tritici-repentis]